MKSRSVAFIVSLSLLSMAGFWGCAAPLERELTVEQLTEIPGMEYYHEWHKVYTVNIKSGKQVRTHVGFTDRRYSQEDSEGKTFVLDLLHVNRGFLLASGKTYAFKIREGQLAGWDDLALEPGPLQRDGEDDAGILIIIDDQCQWVVHSTFSCRAALQ